MNKKIFTNVKVAQTYGIIEDGIVAVSGGVISAVGTRDDYDTISRMLASEGAAEEIEIIDGRGLYLGPGLVDIHTHASDVQFFTEDPIACAQHHLMHGTTSVFPALYFSFTPEQYIAAINQMKEASQKPGGINIAGVYMEGPFLNPKFGCDKENNPWKTVDPGQYMPVIEAAKDFAAVYCVAPERDNILQYVHDVKTLVPDAVFAVAHSEASSEQVEAIIPYGLKIGTHFSDATGKVHKWSDVEIVGVGPDEVVLMHDDIYAELIVDNMGVHVDPYLIRLVRKVKGDDRVILISDAYAAAGPRPEEYKDCFDINFDFTGEIAGSKLTLDQACRNMMKHSGCGIAEVFKFAASNPARAIGFNDRGEIAAGKRADIILVDSGMNVEHIYIAGNKIR